MLFKLSYRNRQPAVLTGLIEAPNEPIANAEGHRVCDERGWKFCALEPAILNAPVPLAATVNVPAKKPAA